MNRFDAATGTWEGASRLSAAGKKPDVVMNGAGDATARWTDGGRIKVSLAPANGSFGKATTVNDPRLDGYIVTDGVSQSSY